MKKFKLIALTLLASTFGLTSCDIPEFMQPAAEWARTNIPGADKLIPAEEEDGEKEQHNEEDKAEDKVLSVEITSNVEFVSDEDEPFKLAVKVEVQGNATKEVTWSSSDPSVATVNEQGLVTPLKEGEVTITATSKADSTKSDSVSFSVVAFPRILSITLSGAESEVSITEGQIQLTATVESKGQVAQGVTWGSSNTSVATVDSNGLVTLLATGEVTISATSTYDKSVKGELSFTVTYVQPLIGEANDALNEWLIEQGAKPIGVLPEVEGNLGIEYFYDEEYDCFSIAISVEDVAAAVTAYAQAMSDLGFDVQYDSEYDYYFIETPELRFNINEWNGKLYLDSYFLGLPYYEFPADDMLLLFNFGFESPVENVGNYEVASEDAYFKIAYGEDFFEVDVYNSTHEEMEAYVAGLEALGWDISDGEYEGDFHCEDFLSGAVIEAQDWIDYSYGCVRLICRFIGLPSQEWPGEELATFVAEDIGSENEVPAFASEGTFYKSGVEEDEETGERSYQIELFKTNPEDVLNYALALEAEHGFELLGSINHYMGSDVYGFQKGKLCITVGFEYGYHISSEEEIEAFEAITDEEVAAMDEYQYEEFYMDSLYLAFYGYFPVYDYDLGPTASYIIVYGDPDGIEGEGLFFELTSGTMFVGDESQLSPIFNEIEEAPLTWTSSDESIATVNEQGVITAIAAGEAEITASIEGTEFAASFALTVKERPVMPSLEKVNAWLAEKGATEELSLPNVPSATEYGAFSYYSSSDCYYILVDLEGTVAEAIEEYAALLEEAGWEISTSGSQTVAKLGDVKLALYAYQAYLNIDIFYDNGVPVEVHMPSLDDVNSWLSEQGASEALVLPDVPAATSYGNFYYWSSAGCYYIMISVDGAVADAITAYAAILEEAGWEITVDGMHTYAVSGDFKLDMYTYSGKLDIDIYYTGEVAAMTPEQIATELAYWFDVEPTEVEEGVFAFSNMYDASVEDNSPEKIMAYMDDVFEYMFPEFEAYEWEEVQEGMYCAYYYNSAETVVEAYVYSSTVYVDGEGNIVEEGTEDATPVDVTAVQVYCY